MTIPSHVQEKDLRMQEKARRRCVAAENVDKHTVVSYAKTDVWTGHSVRVEMSTADSEAYVGARNLGS